jgi:hypothetical protein
MLSNFGIFFRPRLTRASLKINKYAKKKSNSMLNTTCPPLDKTSKSIIVIFSFFLIISIFFEGSLNGILVDAVKEVPNPKSKMLPDVQVHNSQNATNLGSPFMKLYLKSLKHKDVLTGGMRSTLISVAGNGTADNVDFKLNRSLLLAVPMSNHFADVEGRGRMIVDGQKGYSYLTFRERIYNNTVTNQSSSGVMFFTNSNGSLTFLDNSVAIFRQTNYINGMSLITAWRWN